MYIRTQFVNLSAQIKHEQLPTFTTCRILLEDLNVYQFGSKIGFLHGSTGNWLLNVTDSFSSAHSVISDQTVYTNLNLAKIFDTASDYYTDIWNKRHKNHTIGSLGQAILVLAPLIRVSESELEESLISLKKLRRLHPDVNVIYYTTPEKAESLQRLLISQEDRLVTTLRINDISTYLLEIPNSLRPGPCNPNVTRGIRDQIEGYVAPQEVNIYRLDPLWRSNTKRVTVKIVGFGYGALEICMWNQRRNSITKELFTCRELSGDGEEELTDFDECKGGNCPGIFYKVRGLSSTKNCAGK